MLPTVEQVHPAGKSFPCGRVDSRGARAVPSPATVLGPRTAGAALVVELRAETRPTSSLPRRMWREVDTAGGSHSGRGSP